MYRRASQLETNMLPDNDSENLFASRLSILGLLLLVALLA
jgi:hypothetical protein